MTAGLSLVMLATAAAAATLVLIIREIHIHALNTRVSNAVLGIPDRSTHSQDMIGWFSSIGMRFRHFYADENLEQLRTILRSAGFNHHRTLPIWIGVKIVSMVLFLLIALLVAQLKADPRYGSEAERVQAFIAKGGGSRSTYFNLSRKLQPPKAAPTIRLNNPSLARKAADEALQRMLRRWSGRFGEN